MGISGMPGSGKASVTDIATERGAIIVSMGDIIREEAKKRGEGTKETARKIREEFGQYINKPINKEKNLLLVGDAAGFVDPITGEGIYFAVLSGIKASEIIIKAIKTQ